MPVPFLALGALRLLPSSLKVGLVVGLVSAGLFGIFQWRHTREVGGFRKDLAAATQQRDAEHVRAVEFEGALRSMTANRDLMASRVADQNRQIEQLEVTRRLIEQTASLAAVRVVQSATAAADELRAPTTTVKPGHEPMNEWFTQFGRVP